MNGIYSMQINQYELSNMKAEKGEGCWGFFSIENNKYTYLVKGVNI